MHDERPGWSLLGLSESTACVGFGTDLERIQALAALQCQNKKLLSTQN